MNTAKTLALGALAALSIGIGSAMAQSEGPSMSVEFYRATDVSTLGHQAAIPAAVPVQSGSSDTDTVRPESRHVLPFNGDYGDLANPG
jgi:hypothetical protein